MTERMKFIVAVDANDEDFASICRAFGISRTTGYKWVKRFEEEQLFGLRDHKRAPASHPNATSDEVVSMLLAARKGHPHWGPRKLRAWLLARDPGLVLPAASTIGDILKRYGLVRARRRRLRVPVTVNPLAEFTGCNDTWATDFKGQRRLGDGVLCYPLTITDLHSRYLLKVEGLLGTRSVPVREQFDLVFREFGLPQRIRSDNGTPFASVGPGSLSRLSVWWVKLGITPERIEKGNPQQNGSHERMHRTLEEAAFFPPCATMLLQQLSFDRFRAEFNNERPHEAIGQRPPSSLYVSSVRTYRGQEKSPEYDGSFEVRRVNSSGMVKWKGHKFSVGIALGDEPVGFKQEGETTWSAWFGPVVLYDIVLLGKQLQLVAHPPKSEPIATVATTDVAEEDGA